MYIYAQKVRRYSRYNVKFVCCRIKKEREVSLSGCRTQIMTEKHVSSTFYFMPCQYCPDCDELLCKLNSDIKWNFRGWCSNCKLIWLLSGNYCGKDLHSRTKGPIDSIKVIFEKKQKR